MKVLYGLGSLKKAWAGPKAITIGVFDGVHRGHKKILRVLCRLARRKRMPSGVLTFQSHPTRTLTHQESVLHLTSLAHKLLLLEREGVDICFVIDFTRAFAGLEPVRFVRDILMAKIGMRALVVGEDFVFGKDASGDVRLLRELAKPEGFIFRAVPRLSVRGKIVSSTLIRRLIGQGDLRGATALLGRPVSILGDVVVGEGRGRALGFPTANVKTHHEVLLPDGIYACRARCLGRWHNGVAYIGRKPTFSKRIQPGIEVFIFEFNNNIYGRSIEIEFVDKIRSDRKFPDADSLVAQMKIDARAARSILTL